MKLFWEYFYSFCIIPSIWVVIQILGLFNAKVRRGIHGRRDLFVTLQDSDKLDQGKRVWFHASSLGEFEQAKPIIAQLKQRYPGVRVIVTFFSPSGYEHSKKYQLADVISYIPFDSRKNAKQFLDLTKPDVAVIIRYDVWPNHLWELQRRGIPILIANATMRATTKRRIPFVRNFHHHVYNAISDILTVSPSDLDAFRIFSLTKPVLEAVGDTRYDQVSIRSNEAKKRHLIAEHIVTGKQVLVAGSSWPEDEEVLIPAFLQLQERLTDLLLIIVPHEPSIEHLEDLEAELIGKAKSIRFSALNDYNGERVIIVDSIGILLALYTYANISYIGGSFKQNVHNVLEAAVFGIPVVYGPRHKNSQEAVSLVELGGGFVVYDPESLYERLLILLKDSALREKSGIAASNFVQHNIGATELFLKHLERYLKN